MLNGLRFSVQKITFRTHFFLLSVGKLDVYICNKRLAYWAHPKACNSLPCS